MSSEDDFQSNPKSQDSPFRDRTEPTFLIYLSSPTAARWKVAVFSTFSTFLSFQPLVMPQDDPGPVALPKTWYEPEEDRWLARVACDVLWHPMVWFQIAFI
jgi:hypothetical protein